METVDRTRLRFDSLQQEAFLGLWRTYDRLRSHEDELFASFDLTPQQYNVLRLLQASHPVPMPTLAVAERLVSKAPDITRMLDKLVERGWVERTRSASDRRTVLVGILPQGEELLSRIAAPLRECHQAQLGHLTPKELKLLVKLLQVARRPHESEDSAWR